MTKTFNVLLIAAALSFLAVITNQRAEIATGGARSVQLAQHGETSCVLVGKEIFCASRTVQPAIRLLSYDLN